MFITLTIELMAKQNEQYINSYKRAWGQTCTLHFTDMVWWCKVRPCHEHRVSTFRMAFIT
jgi:hypothetical protein